MGFLGSQTFRHMMALLIIQAKSRHPGQGSRDLAVSVPEVWNGFLYGTKIFKNPGYVAEFSALQGNN